jgi:hypothetical protein
MAPHWKIFASRWAVMILASPPWSCFQCMFEHGSHAGMLFGMIIGRSWATRWAPFDNPFGQHSDQIENHFAVEQKSQLACLVFAQFPQVYIYIYIYIFIYSHTSLPKE